MKSQTPIDASITAGLQAFLSRTLAVLVLYRRSPGDSSTLQSLGRSLSSSNASLDLFIYDNSPDPCLIEDLGLSFRLDYHHDPSNPGVSRAYNEGARIAREKGKRWLLLLDQDTLFPKHAVADYAAAVAGNPASLFFAPLLFSGGRLLSPCGFRFGTGFYLSETPAGKMELNGRSILNSGMLVDLSAFEEVGGFDERIPLDFADHDFCRRVSDHFGAAFIIDLPCEHGFSDSEGATLEGALARYAFFCRGARQCMRSFPDRITNLPAVILRCLVLSIRYRTMRFIPVMLRVFGR